jgi:hypothetical protein
MLKEKIYLPEQLKIYVMATAALDQLGDDLKLCIAQNKGSFFRVPCPDNKLADLMSDEH